METIEQKQIRLLRERLNFAKKEYSFAKIAKVCNMQRQEVQRIQSSLEYDSFYKPYERTIEKLNDGLDKLGIPNNIPKQDTEVFDGVMQGLKEAKEFLSGKDNGSEIRTKDGKWLKGQEAVDYYQALKKTKGK